MLGTGRGAMTLGRKLRTLLMLALATSANAGVGYSNSKRFLNLASPTKPVCPYGYLDKTNGQAYLWRCGENSNCPGHGTWTAADCSCACVLPHANGISGSTQLGLAGTTTLVAAGPVGASNTASASHVVSHVPSTPIANGAGGMQAHSAPSPSSPASMTNNGGNGASRASPSVASGTSSAASKSAHTPSWHHPVSPQTTLPSRTTYTRRTSQEDDRGFTVGVVVLCALLGSGVVFVCICALTLMKCPAEAEKFNLKAKKRSRVSPMAEVPPPVVHVTEVEVPKRVVAGGAWEDTSTCSPSPRPSTISSSSNAGSGSWKLQSPRMDMTLQSHGVFRPTVPYRESTFSTSTRNNLLSISSARSKCDRARSASPRVRFKSNDTADAHAVSHAASLTNNGPLGRLSASPTPNRARSVSPRRSPRTPSCANRFPDAANSSLRKAGFQ